MNMLQLLQPSSNSSFHVSMRCPNVRPVELGLFAFSHDPQAESAGRLSWFVDEEAAVSVRRE